MKKFPLIGSILLLATACQSSRSMSEPPRAVVSETYVHKYGFEVDPQEWQSRQSHGQKVTTLNNGVTVTESYNFGQLQGETTYSFPYSTSIERSQLFDKGNLSADETRYMGNIPKKRTEFLDADKKTVKQWYENGSPHSIETFDRDKLVTGEYFTFSHQPDSSVTEGSGTRTNRDPYGQLTSRETIDAGEMIERISYWPNGTPKEILPFKNNIVHGLRRTYYVGGEPDRVEQWENGVQNGISIIYQNGEKYAEVPYTNGTKNGLEKRFLNGDQLFEEISWVDGREKGPAHNYKVH